MSFPRVTVFMPVYNGEKYLNESIDSVLAQTFTDFELILLNDGSTDRSKTIIDSYRDPRILKIDNPRPSGLMAVRNQGLNAARAEYIAPIDCDDVWEPHKLEMQIAFLERQPKYPFVGSRSVFIDGEGKERGTVWRYDFPPEVVSPFLLFGNYFIHSSVVMRRSMIPKEGYQATTAEDYDLWARMSRSGPIWSLPETLVKYRVHIEGDTFRQAVLADRTQQQVRKIYLAQLQQLGLDPTTEELELHYTLGNRKFVSLEQLAEGGKWLCRIAAENNKRSLYDAKALQRVVVERWLISCFSAKQFGLMRVLRTYFALGLHKIVLIYSPFLYLRSFLRYLKNKDLGKLA